MQPLRLALLLLLVAAAPVARAQFLAKNAVIVVASADFFGANKGKGGGLWLLSPNRQTYTKLALPTTGPGLELKWASSVVVHPRTGLVYVGTGAQDTNGGGNVYEVTVLGTKITNVRRLTAKTPTANAYLAGIALRGNRVWYVANYDLGWVELGGANQKNEINLQPEGLPQCLTSNGRELFIGMSANQSSKFNLYSWDPGTANAKPVALVLTSPPTSLGQANMVEGGKVFVTDFRGVGHVVDPVTRAVTTLNPTARAPQSSGHAGILNPWTGEYFVGPGYSASTAREIHAWDRVKQQWTQKPLGTAGPPGFPTNIGSMHRQPFTHFGTGCPGTNKSEPRIGSANLAKTGSTNFAITLRSADASRPAFLMLGGSNSQMGPITLPFGLGPIGAGGCALRVSMDLVLPGQTDAKGNAARTLGIPGDPSLVDQQLFVQWGVTTTANRLGIVTSDGAAFVIG